MDAVTAVLLFCGLTLLLVLVYAVPRVPQVLLGKKPADHWTRGNTTNDPALLVRAHHAHLNALETLPVFAAVVLAAVATGRAEAVAALAPFVFYARVGQVVVHLIGTSFVLVVARATFFLVQVALILTMILRLI